MGRRLPAEIVSQLYSDYLRLRSLDQVAKLHGRTRQAVWEMFRRRKLQMFERRSIEGVEYKGVRYTPHGRGGYLAATRMDQGTKRRTMLNRVIWEEANGPVPAGFELWFKDGNKRNCVLENLELRKRCGSRANPNGINGYTKQFAEQMVEKHIGFVIQQAEKYARAFNVPIEDMIQCGRIGVMEAAHTYRKGKGANFLTWAKFKIRSEMQNFARVNARIMYRPLARLWEGEDVSMQSEISEDFRIEDSLGTEECVTTALIDQETNAALQAAIQTLHPEVQEILRLRFFENLTFDEIAERYSVTRQAIQSRIENALRKLRRALKEFREAA